MPSRIDIKDGYTKGAWSGSAALPFGLIGCPGWIRPIRQLSNKLASLNRYWSRHGCMAKLVHIRPGSDGEYVTYSLRRYGILTKPFEASLVRALAKARASCLRTCIVCGRPAVAVSGYVCCPAHAPSHVRLETHFDKRKIRRAGVALRRQIGARITGEVIYSEPYRMAFPEYEESGCSMVRVMDAPPGARKQILDVSRGLKFRVLADEWMIEVSDSLVLEE